jgi:putative long chain acyl-CoA synthase
LPAEITKRLIGGLARVLEKPLEAMEGLPGFLTSTAFKLISVRKEAQQLVEFVGNLHDRQALERRESRRRFLGGEGFVAWPGPAFRKFVDEFIVGNRMAQGRLRHRGAHRHPLRPHLPHPLLRGHQR